MNADFGCPGRVEVGCLGLVFVPLAGAVDRRVLAWVNVDGEWRWSSGNRVDVGGVTLG